MLARLFAAPLFAFAFAIGSFGCADNMGDGGSPVDSGVVDTGMELPPRCSCETFEDCPGCIAHIGQCCYEDTSIGGQAQAISKACEDQAVCRSCCNECMRKSCEELLADHECPNR